MGGSFGQETPVRFVTTRRMETKEHARKLGSQSLWFVDSTKDSTDTQTHRETEMGQGQEGTMCLVGQVPPRALELNSMGHRWDSDTIPNTGNHGGQDHGEYDGASMDQAVVRGIPTNYNGRTITATVTDTISVAANVWWREK